MTAVAAPGLRRHLPSTSDLGVKYMYMQCSVHIRPFGLLSEKGICGVLAFFEHFHHALIPVILHPAIKDHRLSNQRLLHQSQFLIPGILRWGLLGRLLTLLVSNHLKDFLFCSLRLFIEASNVLLCSWARHSHNASLHPAVYKWVLANLMLGVTLRWTSIPSRGE